MTTQNSLETAPARPVGRPFEKGQSGNPGGRPKGLAKRIRAETRDGEELVEVMLGVLRDASAARKDRMQAATWLADRGFGKPVQTISAEVDEAEQRRLELASMPDPELERQVAEIEKRLGLKGLPEKAG
jgi:hypothetical protein